MTLSTKSGDDLVTLLLVVKNSYKKQHVVAQPSAEEKLQKGALLTERSCELRSLSIGGRCAPPNLPADTTTKASY